MWTLSPSKSKFTRGEKCIFAHLITTFVAIIVIVIIYFVHLCVVRHAGNDEYRISRRHTHTQMSRGEGNYSGWSIRSQSQWRCVGAVYVSDAVAGAGAGWARRARLACGAALVSAQWSVAPAQCVAARARPDLAHLLPYWTLRYERDNQEGYESAEVHRGVLHPLYDADELTANVGLFEHEEITSASSSIAAPVPHCTIPTETLKEELFRTDNEEDVVIAAWPSDDSSGAAGVAMAAAVALSSAQCAQYTAPVVRGARPAEFCLVPRRARLQLRADRAKPMLGSAVFVKERMVGIASWGDTRGEGFPLVVLDISHFATWLHTTMSL